MTRLFDAKEWRRAQRSVIARLKSLAWVVSGEFQRDLLARWTCGVLNNALQETDRNAFINGACQIGRHTCLAGRGLGSTQQAAVITIAPGGRIPGRWHRRDRRTTDGRARSAEIALNDRAAWICNEIAQVDAICGHFSSNPAVTWAWWTSVSERSRRRCRSRRSLTVAAKPRQDIEQTGD